MIEKKYISIGTEELAYFDEGNKDAVLLLHGNLSSSMHLLPVIERLKEDFRCVAPDMRGFGDSSYKSPIDSIDELAEDVSMLMDRLGIPSAFVVGWSTGGTVALKLAAMHPEKVRKLFSIEGVGYMGYPIYQKDAEMRSTGYIYETKEAMAADPFNVAPIVRRLESRNTEKMDRIFKRTVYTVSQPDPEYNAILLQESMKQRNLVDVDWALCRLNMSAKKSDYAPGDGSIRNISCLAAFTTGDHDTVVPYEMILSNVNALGPLATLIRYENCGHSPMVDCPDRLAQDIKEFFEKGGYET